MKKNLTSLLACLFLTAANAAPSLPNLVGWWHADGNAQDSSRGHDGALPFGIKYAPGKVGQAFDFDGKSRQRVAVPDHPDFRLTNALTIEGWIYPRQYGGIIFFYGDDRAGLDPYSLDLNSPGFIAFQIDDSKNQAARIEAPIQLNQWQHVAATFGARGTMHLFINGELVAQTNTTLKPLGKLDASRAPAIGIGNHGSTAYEYPFNGLIDEIALHSVALNQRQVRAIYNSDTVSTPAPIVRDTILPANGLVFREIRYDGKLADEEARFTLDIDVEATNQGESSAQLLEGDVAILPGKLPDQLKIVREGNRYVLVASHPGQFKFKLEIVAKIQRAEPWNQVSFSGPTATIASVTAQAAGSGMEVQLLNGTLLDSAKTNGVSRVKGFLGADQTIALRWQGKVAEIARKALLTVDSTITAQITPSVVKYTSQFRYDIVQGNAAQLTLALPATQALTRLVGEQIRDWHTTTDGDRQTLTIEFIKPVEKSYSLTLYSEQPVESGAGVNSGAGILPAGLASTTQTGRQDACPTLNPPQPLEVERESGALTVSAEDTLVEIESLAGLRQVNAPDKAIAAYRFNARPFTLALKLKYVEPVISVADRVNARLEETRLVISHGLSLNVEKAGVYAIELVPQAGFAVADVRGDGVEDWKVSDGKLRVNFSARVLGQHKLDVQLEQPLKNFPEQIGVAALRVIGATKETAQIGTASAAGIRLKTATLSGLREIPVRDLQRRTDVAPVSNSNQNETGATPVLLSDELLAYTTEQPDWKLFVACEHLAARVVADVFNLVTIGDGIVGGSATIRYGLANQGVQEFKVKLPPQCKNVEFTGPNIRRKELSGDVWTIGLQDKAWGGYTLVVTYDYQFDPKGATLPIGGIHTADVERETGSLAITTAASLQLNAKTVSDSLHRVDEAELSSADRALVTRAVVLAWQYAGDGYSLDVDVKRYGEERVLEAVADRTQITSVITEAGEMLTQASFMVKNNEKQFQRFQLPKDAKLWGCYVNGQPAKPERDGDWVLVSLPRDVNRDQAFAVDITYSQTNGALASTWSKNLELSAPRTDVPNTYAEWQIFVPPTLRLSSFGGSMNIAQGTTYELLDAWEKFLAFYVQVLREAGSALLVIGLLAFLVIAFVISAARRGWNGLINVLVVVAILAILGAMMLPALSKAKSKAQSISSLNNLKQIGLATRIWSGDNGDRLPMSFEEMKNELGTDKITYDPESGQRYTYIGAGMSEGEITPDSVIAYGPVINNHCNVLMADGSVQRLTAQKFYELNQRGLIQRAGGQQVAAQQQAAVMRGQFANTPAAQPAISGAAGMGGVETPAMPPAIQAPTAAGIRSLRIELPQTGTPFLFTKVLNVGNEPLSIHANIMRYRTFQNLQMAWQTAAFLFGLIVWWWQWHTNRNSFILAVALALMLGSVGSLLIQWRALHDALIVGFPVITLAIIALLVWKYWPRGHKPAPVVTPSTPESPAPDSNIPPVVAMIALVLALSLPNAQAANSAIGNRQSAIGNASITSANYSGTVNDRVAMLDATLQFSGAKAGQTIPLFTDDVAVQQFIVKNGSAKLVRDGHSIAVSLGKGSDVTVQVKMLVKVAGDVTKRRLAFEIPPALTSQVALVLDQSEADVDFPAAISFKRILDKDKTRVEAVMGSADHVELLWTPRVKRAAEVAATVFCQNSALVTLGGGVVNVRATMDYQVTQGELRQARVQIPAGQRLLRVEAPGIRTWEIKDRSAGGSPASFPVETSQLAGGPPALPAHEQTLVVDLLKGMSPAWRLTVETEKSLDALPVSAAIEVPHALDVKRETGLVGLRGAEELGLSVESTSDLQRVDAEEFARAGVDKADGLASAFRFSKPEFALRVRAEAVQPQIEAVVKNYFRAGAEQLSLSATVDFTIKRAGVFSLKVALPDGYRVEHVNGNNILQQAERTENGARVLEVTLKDRTSGAYRLGLELARSFKELPKSLRIAGVYPLGAVKLTGYVAVSADAGVAAKTELFDGLMEIPAVTLPDFAGASGGSVLAYKFISPEPKAAAEWKLSVATDSVASWVRAEIVNTITLTETLVSGRSLMRYDIANAPVKELRVKVPESFRNVEITGANIRSRELVAQASSLRGSSGQDARATNGNIWRVELQSATRGIYTLNVTWEQPRAAKTNSVELAGASAEGVERETGLLAISAKAPLQVSESSAADLQRVDTGDVPDWAGRPDETTALVYRYVRPDYKLTLDTRRFDEAEVLQALVDSAKLTTVVADDGQMMTEMSLSVRNNGRQFLEVELPAGAKVWSAFVAGQPVRPSLREGKLLLPIQQSGADDGALTVELTYVGANPFPRARGAVGFISPKFDVPLKNARWEVYLPPDYDYQNFAGTMSREVAAAQTWSSSFSLLDYSRKETQNKQLAKAEARKDVAEANRQLAGGNVREANATLSRAKGKFYSSRDEDEAVKKLEKDVQTAQASNLINAQTEFSFRNNGQIVTDGKVPAQVQLYDNFAAEQQWAKLQQAQEIVAAKVQPLRVNLPVRGSYFAFNQVLQTETGKPMTIQLLAASTKMVNWPARIGTALAAFLLLWGMVAVFSHATRRREA
jgi:prepilin-type processing-associated H-X9-DG protein